MSPRQNLIPFYGLTENLFDEARVQLASKTIEAIVKQGHAKWINGGTAAQLITPTRLELATTITDRDMMANAGADNSEVTIALARQKVEAWSSVYDTKSPLPGRPGAVKITSTADAHG